MKYETSPQKKKRKKNVVSSPVFMMKGFVISPFLKIKNSKILFYHDLIFEKSMFLLIFCLFICMAYNKVEGEFSCLINPYSSIIMT